MRFHSPKRQKSTRDLKASRKIVNDRSQGMCEMCGGPLPVLDDGSFQFEFQHRQAKQRHAPDNRPENGLALHPVCHQWITEHPANAVAMGWSVEQHADPATTPVLIAGRLCLLTADGGVLVLDEVA